MAPTGPRASRQQTTQRSATRPTRGGGITKNRVRVKTDRDGDIAMDSPAAGATNGAERGGSRGRGRASRASARGSTRVSTRLAQLDRANPNRVTLKVLGLRESKAAGNPDKGRRALIEFLEKKASKSKRIIIGRSVLDGEYLWISINKDDAADVLRLSGYAFAGSNLYITETEEKMPGRDTEDISKEAQETKQKLLSVLARRYNPEQRLLDLSALGADEVLSTMGTFDSQTLAEKAFKVLVHIASAQYKTDQEKAEAIQAVSLARNDINDVAQVFSLALSLPDLKQLDLTGNKLDTTSKLNKWQLRFKNLAELHLTGNPVTVQENYVTEMLQWFPALQILDGRQVRTPEEAAAALKALEPSPIAQFPSNIRDGENNVAAAFLQAFFPMFDTDRARLAAEFYDGDTWFSLAAIPDSGRNLPWKSYMKYSRNIQAVGARTPAMVQRLFTNGTVIADLWKALPPTRHAPMDEPGRWLVDCHTFPHLADPSGQAATAMGLMINVHGQFDEADPSTNIFGTRTFTRTFILGPSKPSTPPPAHPYRVLSDQLTLHKWVEAPKSETNATPLTISTPAVVNTPAVVGVAGIPNDAVKAQLIEQLSKRTGMTAQYSRLCLEGAANWNFAIALQSFEEQKSNLPPEAFVAAV
ncbi:hypothetical protein QBC47DRAFT_459013 [Echria macrotheca]|uniref:mRNA export factor MEX67 n=1 Tax=Echria macrotheca TaxID=438768 RepID=A0AAJ0BGJ0_9PEZI|nr:hypothetical protein QBC47DRAFT_459013 [Echria macrotheca]